MNESMIADKDKMRMINLIDIMGEKSPRSIRIDLNRMRQKYIFKDISRKEANNDLSWLKNVKEIIIKK